MEINKFKALSIFCGSSMGNDECYYEDAQRLGHFLALQHIEVIYGGAKVGLMGTVADAALHAGGKVTGVIPTFLKHKEIAHQNLTKLIEVETMHERKMIMYEKSDGAIVLPGGFGTMDELFELLTWGQLGMHNKPIGILNINGYYDMLISFIDNMVIKGLLRQNNRDMVIVSDDINTLMLKMSIYQAPNKPKWINLEQV